MEGYCLPKKSTMADQMLQILVVEDDELDRMIMRRALKASGIRHELHFAEDHESGKEAAGQMEYDCIFLDYNLPGGTGLELLKQIRTAGNNSPIIIVTSQGDEKIAVEAMKNGANDYIPKSLLSADGIAQSVRFMVTLKQKEKEKSLLESQLVQTQKKLQTVVANSPIILFALDEDEKFTLFEGKGLEEMKINKQDFIGVKLQDAAVLPIHSNDYQTALDGKEVTSVVEIGKQYFEVFYSPMFPDETGTGKPHGVIGVATDVTAHKRAEEELTRAKQVAEETAKIKEQFLANMSHEIRTPMNGIIGLTRILLETRVDEEQQGYLESIRSCSDNLLVIINDILDFSKIEAGKMSFESVPLSLARISRLTAELFQSKADEKGIGLITDMDDAIPAALMGDSTRLSQILNNLVSNAIKFTNKGEVVIQACLREKSETHATVDFSVKDSGIGIPEKSLSSIFESFTQASSDTTRKFGGTGLGLTIVKQLIGLQGGNIHVTSQEGAGTTFHFHLTFPVADESTLKKVNDIPEDKLDTSHLSILVAEDNPVNQLVVKNLLKKWNTPFEIANNGQEAVDWVQKKRFDVVLMDIQMPVMDGFTATKTIRGLQAPLCTLPIMAMTAHATANEKQKCFDNSMDDYICKPFQPSELKKKLLELTKSGSQPLNGIPVAQTSAVNTITEMPVGPAPEGNHQPEKKASLLTKNLVIDTPPVKREPVETGGKIDLKYLRELSDGNDAFVIEMIEMFLNKTPVALEEMQACFEQQKWEELRQIAHRIKPSFGYIGLPATQQSLGEIERLSEETGQSPKLAQLMVLVESVSRSAFNQLEKELVSLR